MFVALPLLRAEAPQSLWNSFHNGMPPSLLVQGPGIELNWKKLRMGMFPFTTGKVVKKEREPFPSVSKGKISSRPPSLKFKGRKGLSVPLELKFFSS